ncbi:MAG TPA: hypothetical protein PLP01_13150 [Phycisphaerae bacterium]|nr:hypothetical protein [Phycisphaerae bacterium]HOI56192.1 hypothetical protein [Phycisphaerae bacterium]
MASGIRRFIQSPLRVVLTAHMLCVLASWGVLAAGVAADGATGGPGSVLESIGIAVTSHSGEGGMTLFWILVIPLAVLMLFSLVCGLVYGRWGLPGYLQGRTVLVAPVLSAACFVIGWSTLMWIEEGTVGAAWQAACGLLSGWAGASLVLLYAAMSTSAVGLGWAASLAVTHFKRQHGKWETVGYVEQP